MYILADHEIVAAAKSLYSKSHKPSVVFALKAPSRKHAASFKALPDSAE